MKFTWFLIALLGCSTLYAQSDSLISEELLRNWDDRPRGRSAARIAFWNVENLFDVYDDPEKRDESFTPAGDNHWNTYKYNDKLQKLSKTLTALGGWEAVEVICLSEVENRKVLLDLINTTALNEVGYEIIHEESPDNRGIDVALLYRPDKFEVTQYRYIRVDFGEGQRPTRDILYVQGVLNKHTLIHLFVNHWPSRYGGHLATEPKRKFTAGIVRAHVDSIFQQDPQANVLITGDFNDEPEDQSLSSVLAARQDTVGMKYGELYNMMFPLIGKVGTHKFAGNWGILDQFIVSKATLTGASNGKLTEQGVVVFKAPFLLTEDKTHMGTRLYRTYQGPKYVGGYSDHLPIYVDLRTIRKTASTP